MEGLSAVAQRSELKAFKVAAVFLFWCALPMDFSLGQGSDLEFQVVRPTANCEATGGRACGAWCVGYIMNAGGGENGTPLPAICQKYWAEAHPVVRPGSPGLLPTPHAPASSSEAPHVNPCAGPLDHPLGCD